jgi:hypothetical protein
VKRKSFTAAAASALIVAISFAPVSTFSFLAVADEPVAATTAMPAAPQPHGDDQGRPRHHIDEDREKGFEGIQLVLVGAAIVVALGLAYRAGRRRRDA